MTNKNEALSNLMQTIDQAKIKINPLPRHYLANNADVRTRELYASLLGSVVLSNGRISDIEHRLFTMLLVSLDIDAKVERYLSNLQTVEIEELIKNLDNDNKRQVLIFDSLLLARCDSPLSIEQVELISELSDLLLLKKDDLNYTLYWAGKLLGAETKLYLENKDKYIWSFRSTDRLKDIKLNCNLDGFMCRNEKIIEGVVFQDPKTNSIINSGWMSRAISFADNQKVYIEIKYSGFIISNSRSEEQKVSLNIIKIPYYLITWKDTLSQIYP